MPCQGGAGNPEEEAPGGAQGPGGAEVGHPQHAGTDHQAGGRHQGAGEGWSGRFSERRENCMAVTMRVLLN